MIIESDMLSRECLQIFWITGTIERLATLGAISASAQINSELTDLYLCLDTKKLFENDAELAELARAFIISVAVNSKAKVPEQEELLSIIQLIMEYRDNPEKLAQFSLHYYEK